MKQKNQKELKENNPETISQKYYTIVETPSYKFKIIYAELLSDETVEFPHFHPYYEIYYVLDGQADYNVENETHTLHPGDLLFLAPNVLHNTIYDPINTRNYFAIIFDFIEVRDKQTSSEFDILREEFRDKLNVIQKNSYFITRVNFNDRATLSLIQEEMRKRVIGYTTIVNSLYHHFVIRALRTIDSVQSNFKDPQENLNLGLEASKYIHNNYFRDISIQSVADYLNISPRHVNRVFYDMFGTTFSRTLTALRCSYAKKYLLTTDYSVEKIAELTGFKSPHTLYKVFHEEHMTISQFRAKYGHDKKDGSCNQS